MGTNDTLGSFRFYGFGSVGWKQESLSDGDTVFRLDADPRHLGTYDYGITSSPHADLFEMGSEGAVVLKAPTNVEKMGEGTVEFSVAYDAGSGVLLTDKREVTVNGTTQASAILSLSM